MPSCSKGSFSTPEFFMSSIKGTLYPINSSLIKEPREPRIRGKLEEKSNRLSTTRDNRFIMYNTSVPCNR